MWSFHCECYLFMLNVIKSYCQILIKLFKAKISTCFGHSCQNYMSWILNLNFKEYESLFFKNLFFLSLTANSVLYKNERILLNLLMLMDILLWPTRVSFCCFLFEYFFEFLLFYNFAFQKETSGVVIFKGLVRDISGKYVRLE